MSDTGAGWRLTILLVLAAAAPFTLKVFVGRWEGVNLPLLTGIGFVITAAVAITGLRHRLWRLDWVDVVALFWFAALWLSALLSDDPSLGLSGAVRFSVPILLIPAVRRVVQSPDDVRRLLMASLVGTVVGACVGLTVWATNGQLDSGRIFFGDVTTLGPFNRLTRPWPHANGAAMVIGATLAAGSLIRSRTLRWFVLALLTVALVLTISRGGLAAGAAVGVVWVVLRRRRVDTVVVGALVAIGVATFALSSGWTTRVDTLGDQAFYASEIEAPAQLVLDRPSSEVELTVTNLSTVTWNADGSRQVLISARWIGPDGMIWTEDRWQLPHTLDPDQSVTTGLTIGPRVPVGDDYRIRWDLLIEDTAYFGQFLGEEPVWTDAVVAMSGVDDGDVVPYDFVPRLVEAGRRVAWQVAWDEFTGAPLLGVGPSQFGRTSGDDLRSEDRIVAAHAHNIVLEPLATWGLLGTIPFAILGVGGFVRIGAQAWRRRELETCVIAVGLVAVAVHGLVDWPLVQAATRTPVGLLLALAWTEQ